MPEQIPTSTAPAIDTGQLLDHILSANKNDLSTLAQKAMTPIAGGHATQMPLSMDPTPRESHAGELDHREVVGAGNARAQGIGNSVIGVMNLLSKTETALDNKKKLEVASATQQLLVAQQAMDQAQQALKNNPNDPDAKAAVERNTAVMNGILGNDKIRKAIAKGMNIDFTDPKANDSLEHAGVAQGKDMTKQHLSYAEQFNQKTPATMQPNVQAQAQYAAAIEQQKINNEAVKSIIPLISAQLRAASADARTKGILDAEKLKIMGVAAVQDAKNQNAWNIALTKIQAAEKLAGIKHQYKLGEIAAEGDNQINTMRAKLSIEASDPIKQLKTYEDFVAKSNATSAKWASTISKLESDKAVTLEQPGVDKTSVTKSYDAQINAAKEAQSAHQASIKSLTDMYKQYAGVYSGSGSNTNSSLGNSDTYLNSLSDDEVETDSDDSDN